VAPAFTYCGEGHTAWEEGINYGLGSFPDVKVKDVFVREGTPDNPIVIRIHQPNPMLDAVRAVGSFFKHENKGASATITADFSPKCLSEPSSSSSSSAEVHSPSKDAGRKR